MKYWEQSQSYSICNAILVSLNLKFGLLLVLCPLPHFVPYIFNNTKCMSLNLMKM